MIPLLAVIRFLPGFGLWIPLFLIWLLLLPIALLLSPIILMACLIFLVNPVLLCIGVWGFLASFRGTLVEVENGSHRILIKIV